MYNSLHFTNAAIITMFFHIMFCHIDTSCILYLALSPLGRTSSTRCFKSRKYSMTSWNALRSNNNTAGSKPGAQLLGLKKRESESIGEGMYHDSVSGQTTDWAEGLEDTWAPVTMSGSNLLWVQYLHKSFLRNRYGCTKVNSSIYTASLKNQ